MKRKKLNEFPRFLSSHTHDPGPAAIICDLDRVFEPVPGHEGASSLRTGLPDPTAEAARLVVSGHENRSAVQALVARRGIDLGSLIAQVEAMDELDPEKREDALFWLGSLRVKYGSGRVVGPVEF